MKTGNFFNYLLIFTFLISSLLFAAPVKAAAGSYHLKVNRYTNTVTVYQKQTDGSEKPIRVMLCSTGGNLTPLGTFKHLLSIVGRYLWVMSGDSILPE